MPRPRLPEKSFAAIAVDLYLYARSARQAFEAGEVMAARGGWTGGLTHTLEELRVSAETAGELYELVKALAPYEEDIRSLLEGYLADRCAGEVAA